MKKLFIPFILFQFFILFIAFNPTSLAWATGNEPVSTMPASGASFLANLQAFLRGELPAIWTRAASGASFVRSGGLHSTAASCTASAISLEGFTSSGNRVTANGSGGTVAIQYDASGIGANCANPGSDVCWVVASALGQDFSQAGGRTVLTLPTLPASAFNRVGSSNLYVDCSSSTQPALPADSVPLMRVAITNGAITDVEDLRVLAPTSLYSVEHYGSLPAMITALTSGDPIELTLSTALYIYTNTTIPTNVTIRTEGPASFTVASGVTFTTQNIIASSSKRIFYGSGTVKCGARCPDEVHPAWFGALYDDSTDDSTAIQKAINMGGDTSVVQRQGVRVPVRGRAAIGTSLTLDVAGVTLDCGGVGSQNRATADTMNNPRASYLRWIGAANEPMLIVSRLTVATPVQNCHFIGNATNKPLSAISLRQVAGVGQQQLTFENLLIGGYTGSTGFVNGIYVGDPAGSGTNNSELLFKNVHVDGCTDSGFRFGSVQNMNITMLETMAWSCLYGVRAAGRDVTVVGGHFCCNTGADFYIPNTDDFSQGVSGSISVTGWSSESSARLAFLSGESRFLISNSRFQLTANLDADTRVITAINDNSTYVSTHSLLIEDDTFASTRPWAIAIKSLAGISSKTLLLDYMRGSAQQPTLDMQVIGGPADRRWLCVTEWQHSVANATPLLNYCNQLAGGIGSYTGTFDSSRQDFPVDCVRFGVQTSTAAGGATELCTARQTLTMSGATVTATAIFPANVMVLGLSSKAATSLTCSGGCTAYEVGDGTTADKWSAGLALAINTQTNISTWKAGITVPYWIQSAENAVFTPNAGAFTGGTVIITGHFLRLISPPSR